MAKNQAYQQDDTFDVVYALYQEAASLSADQASDSDKAAPPAKAAIIQSRKPRKKIAQPPLFTRISDLNDEAQAAKLLAQTDDIAAPDDAPLPEDDFAIPQTFAPNTPSEAPISEMPEGEMPAGEMPAGEMSEGEAQADEVPLVEAFDTTPEPLDDDALALLVNTQDDALDAISDNVSISDEIEPSVSLDDVLDGLSAQDAPAPKDTAPADITDDMPALSDEAKALAALDASRPAADEALMTQLADVKSAVEQAQPASPQSDDERAISEDRADADIEAEAGEDADIVTDEPNWQDVKAGPALAAFIGETVRDVLNEELPHRVRGLVDEALGERQGRYGRSETPHIGLRTKPSRH